MRIYFKLAHIVTRDCLLNCSINLFINLGCPHCRWKFLKQLFFTLKISNYFSTFTARWWDCTLSLLLCKCYIYFTVWLALITENWLTGYLVSFYGLFVWLLIGYHCLTYRTFSLYLYIYIIGFYLYNFFFLIYMFIHYGSIFPFYFYKF